MSGFWVPTLFLLLPNPGTQTLLLTLTLCFWIAHRFSSLYLALCVSEYREVIRTRKGYFFGLPALALVLIAGFILCPESILPIPRLMRVLAIGACDYFFSLYHFAVQHYGVLAVYRSRLKHGQQDRGLLRWDWWLCLTVSGFLSIIMDSLYGEFGQYGLPGLPDAVAAWLVPTTRLLLSVAVISFWINSLRLYLSRKQGKARLMYVSTLCYMTLISFYVEPLIYFAMIQIQHWFVSLGLTTHMAANSRRFSESTELITQTKLFKPVHHWYRSWAWVNAQFSGPLLTLILISLCLTPILEADYYLLQRLDAESLTISNFLIGFKNSIWIYVFASLAFFSSFVHYVYDRGVYRFSDPLTRQAALSLLKRSPY